jgi:hypothetical protein
VTTRRVRSAQPGLEPLTPLLDSITGRVHSPAPRAPGDHVPSRTCYGHLAGEIGVGIYRALYEHDAVRPRPDGMIELGPTRRPTSTVSVSTPACVTGLAMNELAPAQ